MKDPKESMLVMSIPDLSSQGAKDTLASFAKELGPKISDVVLGLETEIAVGNKAGIRDMIPAQGWAAVFVWDKGADDVLKNHWQSSRSSLPYPLYDGYSYGGNAINRLLLLAALASCKVIFRIDPKCCAPDDLVQILDRHGSAIRSGSVDVVSGQYDLRLAARTDFIKEEILSDYLTFLQDGTGIPVLRQITGGALLTIGINGPPAMQFDGIRVWASDDGIFGLLASVNSLVDSSTKVPRMAAGFPLDPTDYLTRVASMVVLRELMKSVPLTDAVRSGEKFLQEVCQYMRASALVSYDLAKAEATLSRSASKIQQGYGQYEQLRNQWPSILIQMRNASGLLSHCMVP